MPTFLIRTIDRKFSAKAKLHNSPDADAALFEAVRSAMMILAEDICEAKVAVAVEVVVEDEFGQILRRSAVSACVASLTVGRKINKPAHTANS